MKKVFLCAILASLSYPAIASSLQDQLSAVAEAEQQGKNEEQRQRYQDHGCGPFQQSDASADGICARHGRRQFHHQQFIVEWEWLK